MAKTRVDILLVEKGLAASRSLAQRYVMAGQVRANGQVVPKPSSKLDSNVELEVDLGAKFVSRGGDKMAAALEGFPVDVSGRICADVGASTGGFTDCMLQAGAKKVFAIDVGHGILHWKLRNDPRVVVMERTNARHVDQLPERVSFLTMDASFISVKILLPVAKEWLTSSADLIILIKPQFEAGRKEVAKGQGVVRKPEIHHRVLVDVLTFVEETGFAIKGLLQSPVIGPKGNIEFLAWLGLPADGEEIDIQALVDRVVVIEE